jgi:murein DD-endopeptidase MepM/ murein hydrolase activator NlpD
MFIIVWRMVAVAIMLSGIGRPAVMVNGPPLGAAVDWRAGPVFRLPLEPPAVVLTPFDPPATRYGRGHRGVDLAGSEGATVRAAGAGVVVFAGSLAGRGVVSIEHPSGVRTTYEPVDPSVVAGATVAAGDPVGRLVGGHAACAPAVCLHWGARLPDGDYLDPLALLRPWRVRLLPWEEPP